MKRILVPGVFLLLILTVAGCDFLRTVAGRPTSSELVARRAQIALREQAEREEQARQQAVRDSLAAAAKAVADSAAAETFFRATRGGCRRTVSLTATASSWPDSPSRATATSLPGA